MKERTKAREFALLFLYHLELPIFIDDQKKMTQDKEQLLGRIEQLKPSIDIEITPSSESFAIELLNLSLTHHQPIGKLIEKYSKKRKIERIAKINLCLLFLSIAEILYAKKTPIKIVINEALELTKKYSSQDSTGFINGVLDSVAKHERS